MAETRRKFDRSSTGGRPAIRAVSASCRVQDFGAGPLGEAGH